MIFIKLFNVGTSEVLKSIWRALEKLDICNTSLLSARDLFQDIPWIPESTNSINP